ncbi:Aminoglycoside phosphotransferase family enzyme [Enhydrobacter aerosaccus]|uniref:Aminoglycoside phosphotransferase family enzyme n=1 Tax=Enhydrobacter aerosaccus TaxID=225324 RepID=A0A1T4T5U2_9HYPH|nr:hypothetical protein [Enhydrobacter aerosaccus]SKA35874.1 Aminoglycoside phosphotransferase family enzyme [Enhydrobacter aerosaccus]
MLPPHALRDSATSKPSVTLAQKVAFLERGAAYGDASALVVSRETHMSWIFLVGEKAYKLKKPVRFPYLDFSSRQKRHAACVSELMLNRRLASDVYERVAPLYLNAGRLSLIGGDEIVDWLVVMRRLDESQTLEQRLHTRTLSTSDLDPLIDRLSRFYRRAVPISLPPPLLQFHWQRSLNDNRKVLLKPNLPLSEALVRRIDRAQQQFLLKGYRLLAQRVHSHSIVDGHGDLRPEHIWLQPTVRIIDCLEFNHQLRTVDPLDEIAFLCVECDRIGDARFGQYIKRRMLPLRAASALEPLFTFYRCYRATLRARLAIAHLLEPRPRTPEKWPRLAGRYLDLALADARRLECMLAQPVATEGLSYPQRHHNG